jgi:hypothetical protein
VDQEYLEQASLYDASESALNVAMIRWGKEPPGQRWRVVEAATQAAANAAALQAMTVPASAAAPVAALATHLDQLVADYRAWVDAGLELPGQSYDRLLRAADQTGTYGDDVRSAGGLPPA